MPIKSLPPAAYLHECLSYDPKTGILTWKPRPENHFPNKRAWNSWNARYANKLAGSTRSSNGYCYVYIADGHHAAHRIAWKLVTGRDPKETIDHRNMRRTDNRWANLREASPRQQRWNAPSRGVSGQKGVYLLRKKWIASINVGGKLRYLGSYKTREEAAAAYEIQARNLHGDFYRK